ncbi:MAG: hypothetical protein MK041_01945 [Aquabacterium sp.]|nr:hypothetical protein [Aquabacterium sp.]
MNDFPDADRTLAASPEREASLRQLTLVTYALYAVSPFVGLTAIVAIIINYIKREETAGTIYASHFDWQIRTFWWGLLWSVIGFVTLFVGVGLIVFFVNGIWMIYRIVKGFLYWNDRKPMMSA